MTATPLALTLLALAPATPQDDALLSGRAEATLEMELEELTLSSGETAYVERGFLSVPMVRADPESKVIQIEIWRFFADDTVPEGTPPVFKLHGGPGWPGLNLTPGEYENGIAPLLAYSDLVIVGQRGIGSSTDTSCTNRPEVPEDATREEEAAALEAACRECRSGWESRGYDLKGLNVIEAAADVDDVRRLLEYDRITLWGGSFGSHWSMTVMRYHPDSVARAILTGMEGPDQTYDRPSGVLNALARMAEEAELSSALVEHVPEEGLIAAFKALVDSVAEEPFEIDVEHPSTGESVAVMVDADLLSSAATGYTRRAGSRGSVGTWPADILALVSGDFEAAGRAYLADQGPDGLPTASFFMLDCGSGITRARLEEYQKDPAVKYVGDLSWWYEATCPAWDSDLGDDFRADFVTEIPTVIVHGTWDISTPFENALELLPMFRNHHFVVVEGGSHGALGEATRFSTEFRDELMEFVATGDTEGLPETIRMPPISWSAPR
jgi:pimeloyl-ACP methyl ester carboxylesterase